MADISGSNGTVTYNSADVPITSWEVTQEEDVINTTDSGNSGWETNIAKGIKRWTASFEGFYKTADTGAALGTDASLVLLADTGITYTGNAIITSKVTTTDVPGTDGVVIAYEATGNGALTEANP